MKAIIFDLDDTLFPEHEYVLSGFRSVDRWLSEKYGVVGFFEHSECLFRERTGGNIFNRALDRLGFSYDESLIQMMLQVYRKHQPVIALHPDATWAFQYFKSHYRLGIITDGYLETQRNKVAALGIKAYFDVIVYSDQFGRECWKPSETPYLKIMEHLQVAGSDCIYVGDNPSKDFVTAKKLGWSTVQIVREGGVYSHLIPVTGYEADCKITSLEELAALVK